MLSVSNAAKAALASATVLASSAALAENVESLFVFPLQITACMADGRIIRTEPMVDFSVVGDEINPSQSAELQREITGNLASKFQEYADTMTYAADILPFLDGTKSVSEMKIAPFILNDTPDIISNFFDSVKNTTLPEHTAPEGFYSYWGNQFDWTDEPHPECPAMPAMS